MRFLLNKQIIGKEGQEEKGVGRAAIFKCWHAAQNAFFSNLQGAILNSPNNFDSKAMYVCKEATNTSPLCLPVIKVVVGGRRWEKGAGGVRGGDRVKGWFSVATLWAYW